MVPETHDIEFPTSDDLRKYLKSDEFRVEVAQKLKDQYVVEVTVHEPKTEKLGNEHVMMERLVLNYTRNNAGGIKDAIDFLLMPLISRGLEQSTVKGSIPRPKSDSFEDSMPYFESKLLHRAEPPMSTESPTRSDFAGDNSNRSIFDKLRKPGSMSSFSSFIERRRKNGSNSPSSLFMHASNNASKASLVSMESRDSGYRNPWNDSGIDLDNEGPYAANGWGSFGGSASRPNTSSNSLTGAFETKFPFGINGNASTTSLNTPMIPGLGMVNGSSSVAGDTTPRLDAQRNGIEKDDASSIALGPAANATATTTTAASTAAPAASTSDTAANATSGYPAINGPSLR